ncbi:HVO_0416 family zinc finger protein [Halogeometricum luteum]|jgi:hypothetical protein|uniref:Small CPxCG-related zinc finger protein n=1 Tax=Halogeometricum luteum TaxID=2950537 RepID=A0ABU2G6F6_9EURY|nr:HVO_0416 family zinc finger protein [Halogeometricum sp. S3BR5-2]MDS0296380.1 hypothetical protein [Halogeometricum sp. S3BR5-2]
MASAPDSDEALFDQFLDDRGHDVSEPQDWETSYNKKQCPDCGALHDEAAVDCTVCGWDPRA